MYPLGNSTHINGELQNMYFDNIGDYIIVQHSDCEEQEFEQGYTDDGGIVHKAFDTVNYSPTQYTFTFNNGIDPSGTV